MSHPETQKHTSLLSFSLLESVIMSSRDAWLWEVELWKGAAVKITKRRRRGHSLMSDRGHLSQHACRWLPRNVCHVWNGLHVLYLFTSELESQADLQQEPQSVGSSVETKELIPCRSFLFSLHQVGSEVNPSSVKPVGNQHFAQKTQQQGEAVSLNFHTLMGNFALEQRSVTFLP